MKVLSFVTDAFGGHGGIALYNRNMLNALCEYSSEISVTVLPRVISNSLESIPDQIDFIQNSKNSRIRYLSTYLRSLVAKRFDLVICSHINLLPFAWIASKLNGSKLVLFVYGKEVWTPLRGTLTNLIVKKVDVVVAIRQYTLDRMSEWAEIDPAQQYILENGIHLDSYGVTPKNPDLIRRHGLDGKQVLLTFARVDNKNFGVDETVRVLPELKKEIPNLVYLIAGSGKYLEDIKRMVNEMNLADSVVFAGRIDESEKADYYRLADAFAMPGSDPELFDTYPIRFSFLEAMACGLPVVASRTKNSADKVYAQIPNINVDPNDDSSIIAGIKKALARGTGEVPEILNNFSFEAYQRKWHSILDEILKK